MRRRTFLATLAAASVALPAQNDRLRELAGTFVLPGDVYMPVGVTRQGTPIPFVAESGALDLRGDKTRLLVLAGLDGRQATLDVAVEGLKRWRERRSEREKAAVALVPLGNPDGWLSGGGPANGSGGDPTRGYPPEGPAYRSPTDPEAQHLWRWVGLYAPDHVVYVAGADENPGAPDSLPMALAASRPARVGDVPVTVVRAGDGSEVDRALARLAEAPRSGARAEMLHRLERPPLETAQKLAAVYGHALDRVVYIPTVALIGRLRLAALTGDQEIVDDVVRIAEPYAGGGRSTLGDSPTSSHLPGHLIFGELARVTEKGRYVDLARRAADLGFGPDGAMRESMPFHNEMSDSVFMGCPILAQTGALTGERKYYEMAVRHFRFMRDLCRRDDGLYRHSPLDETAWGRGNAFPALGLAWTLSETPPDVDGFREMRLSFESHLEALLGHQDPTGLWRQVIDRPEAYRELTATAMITFAIVRGLRRGWIEGDAFERAARRGWDAVQTRVGDDGVLIDVCESTGKQDSLRAYLDREAILGQDDRGGAMALLVATEVERRRRG